MMNALLTPKFKPVHLKAIAKKHFPGADISGLFVDEERIQFDAEGFVTESYRSMLLHIVEAKRQTCGNFNDRLTYSCVAGILEGSRTNDLISIFSQGGTHEESGIQPTRLAVP